MKESLNGTERQSRLVAGSVSVTEQSRLISGSVSVTEQSRLVAGSVSVTEQSRMAAGSSVLGRRCRRCGVGLDAGSVRRVQRLAMSLRVQLPPPAARRHAPAPAPTQDVGRLPDVDPQVRAQRQVAGLAAPEEEEGLSGHDQTIVPNEPAKTAEH